MVKQLLMGNEAFAFAALSSGVRVVAGYPGTPSSEVIETVVKEHAAGRAQGVHVEWSTNEKVALELLAAASITGARTLFTCKQVGLNVASDALMSLNYIGIKGGMVVFVADDPGPISSQTEQDTRRFASFAKVPVLDPATPEQGYDMIRAAFELSEEHGIPVIVRASTRVCHASTFMEIPEQVQPASVSGFKRSSQWVIFPKRAYEAHGEINQRLERIAGEFSTAPLKTYNTIESRCDLQDQFKIGGRNDAVQAPSLGIVAGGVSAVYALEALRMIEERYAEHPMRIPEYRYLQIGTPYPFPDEVFSAFVEGLETIIVFEELDFVLEDAAIEFCGKTHASYRVLGKLTGHASDRGENTVDGIHKQLLTFFGGENDSEISPGSGCAGSLQPPIRPPVLCAGCPHRGSFYAVKRALKAMKQEGIYAGDIGCYTLGNALPLDMVDTCLCMGAGISMAQGFSVVEPHKKHVAFVGDSTFFASGLPGIINALYNQHDICIAVLDNSTTAMTGAQPHPGTGKTLMGTQSKPIDIEEVLAAFGVGTIEHADPFNHKQSTDAATRALSAKGVSAIIFKAPCITLASPQDPVVVNADTCIGCKRCITEIGCPAIGFSEEEKRATVDTSLCTGCKFCIQICPFDAITAHSQDTE